MLNRNVIYFFIIYITVAYLELLRIAFIPREIRLVANFSAILLIIVLLFIKEIYFKDEFSTEKNFAFPIVLIFIGVFLSILIGYFYHGQSITLSLWSVRLTYFYLFYFFLHAFKPSRKQIENIIISIGLITIIFFYIQLIMYPVKLFDSRMSIDRGTLRIFLPGMGCTLITYFYFLNKFFEKRKALFIILALLSYSIFVLQGTRQVILSVALLTLLNIVRSKQIKSKVSYLIIILFGLIILVFIFQGLFIELINVTNEQFNSHEENIRIRAAKFFLSDFQQGFITYILGNSEGHEANTYGLRLLYYKLYFGYYLSDIGIIGDYVRYGVIFTLGAIIILVRSLTIKLHHDYEYLRYFVYLQLFNLFTSGGVFGIANIQLIFILYLFDLGKRQNVVTPQEF